MPLAYESAREAGATLGAGSIVVFDETTDLLGMARRVARFFRDESCGQCVPCRVGTVRQEELLARLERTIAAGGTPDPGQVALLRTLARHVGMVGGSTGHPTRGPGLEPGPHLGPERLFLGSLVEVHDQPAKKE